MRTLLAFCMLLMLAGCMVPPPNAAAPSVMQPPPVAQVTQVQFPACTVGEHVVPLPTTFHDGFFPVTANLHALDLIDRFTRTASQGSEADRVQAMADLGKELYEGTKRGEIAGYTGGALRIVFHAANPAMVPPAVALLDHDQNCRGMIPTERMPNNPGIFAVRVPLSDPGMWPSLVLDRRLIGPRTWVCVKSQGFHLALAPELTKGPYAGEPDIFCGLPAEGGTTRLYQAVNAGLHWMRTPVVAAGG